MFGSLPPFGSFRPFGTMAVWTPEPIQGPATIREAVYALLSQSVALMALTGDRIRWGVLPEDPVYPAIACSITSTVRGVNLSGGDGTAATRIQVDCYSWDQIEADATAAAVVAAFHGFRGRIGSVVILGAVVLDSFDAGEALRAGESAPPFRIVIPIRIHHWV